MTNQELLKLQRKAKRNTKRQSFGAANRWAKVARNQERRTH